MSFYLNRDSLAGTSFCVHLDNKFTPHTNLQHISAFSWCDQIWQKITVPERNVPYIVQPHQPPITSWLNLRPLYTQSYCQTCLISSQQDHSSADQALLCTPSKEVLYALFWVFIFCFVVCPLLWCVCWGAFSFNVWAW